MLKKLGTAFAILATLSASAFAQSYPEMPVRVIVGFAAGSGPDIHARTISQYLGKALGRAFIVENRLGANGTIAARTIAQAKPDGHTLLYTSASIAAAPYIYRSLGYDTLSDLTPIATSGELDGSFILVDEKSPIKTLSELIERAKTGIVLFGSPGVGNGAHLAMELFAQKAGIKMQHVPYRGASEVMTGLLSGSIDTMLITPPSVLGLLKEGRVRALAFTGSKPFPGFTSVPLVKDIVPGYEPQTSWNMFLAPAHTPSPIIDKLSGAIRTALRDPEVANIIQRDGFIPDDRDPAATAAFLKQQLQQMSEAVKAAGIELN